MHTRSGILGLLSAAALLITVSSAQADGAHNVSIVNSTRNAMVSLQIRPSGTSSWQTDVLGAKPLGVKREVSVGVSGGSTCYYDVVSRFEDGHRQTKSHVNLCASSKFEVKDF